MNPASRLRSSAGAGTSGAADGRTARRAVSRQRIEQAATELFAELGYTGSSLDDIAAAAGVSKGTIFYNYKNKATLFEQLLGRAVRTVADDVQQARVGRHGWDAFEAATLRVVERIDENPSPVLIVVNELFRTGRPWAAALPSLRETLVAPMAEILGEVAAERRESIPGASQTSPDYLAHLSMSVFGALGVATLDRRAFHPERSNEQIHQMLMQAVSGLRGYQPGVATDPSKPTKDAGTRASAMAEEVPDGRDRPDAAAQLSASLTTMHWR